MSEARAGQLSARQLAAVGVGESALSATLMLAGLTAAKVLLQLAGVRHYGFFRDELYYLACGEHLAWGYVDQPPLIAFIAWLARHLFGNSIVSVRLFPILAGAAVVFLTGILAHELGGGRFAQFLAAAAMLFAPAYLAFDSFLSMNAFEPVFWLVCAWIVVRIVRGGSRDCGWRSAPSPEWALKISTPCLFSGWRLLPGSRFPVSCGCFARDGFGSAG